jgi:hypothetical protein
MYTRSTGGGRVHQLPTSCRAQTLIIERAGEVVRSGLSCARRFPELLTEDDVVNRASEHGNTKAYAAHSHVGVAGSRTRLRAGRGCAKACVPAPRRTVDGTARESLPSNTGRFSGPSGRFGLRVGGGTATCSMWWRLAACSTRRLATGRPQVARRPRKPRVVALVTVGNVTGFRLATCPPGESR